MAEQIKMAEQFGVDGVKVPPEEFFGMLARFADMFASTVKTIALDQDRSERSSLLLSLTLLFADKQRRRNATPPRRRSWPRCKRPSWRR